MTDIGASKKIRRMENDPEGQKPARKIEFGIFAIESVGDRAVIDGRCHDGPILIGDKFTSISKVNFEGQHATKFAGPRTVRLVSPVEMKVESILAYRHHLTELSPGLTARLELSGCGFEHLKADLVLS